MMKININQYNKLKEKKMITIRFYSTYSESTRPWYVRKELMTYRKFLNYTRNWRVQEFKNQDSWRISFKRTNENLTYSWKDGYICQFHD